MNYKDTDSVLTPSPLVDELWHHHMTFSTSAYRNFCYNFFGGFLHHIEGDGSDESIEKHKLAYSKTLDLYKSVFNQAPPACIWPGSFDPVAYSYKQLNLTKVISTKLLVRNQNEKYVEKLKEDLAKLNDKSDEQNDDAEAQSLVNQLDTKLDLGENIKDTSKLK